MTLTVQTEWMEHHSAAVRSTNGAISTWVGGKLMAAEGIGMRDFRPGQEGGGGQKIPEFGLHYGTPDNVYLFLRKLRRLARLWNRLCLLCGSSIGILLGFEWGGDGGNSSGRRLVG